MECQAWAARQVTSELCSFSKLSVTSPTSQFILILQAFRHFTYVTSHSPTLPSLYLHHNSFSNPSVASPTSQLILQPYFRFSYVTGFSPTSPGEPSMVPSGEIGTFPTYFSLVLAQPFLSFPYVCIKTPFLITSNDTGWEWSMLFMSQSTSKQRCTYSHTLIFVVLAKSMQYPYTQFFNLAY